MEPLSFDQLLIAGIYYVLVIGLTFFAVFGVYVLLRYGKNRLIALTVSGVFTVIYISLLASSYATLQSII